MTLKVGSMWKTHQSYIDDNPPPEGVDDVGTYKRACDGALRVEVNDGRAPLIVGCDRCNFALGVPQRDAGRADDGPPPAPKPDFEAGF